MRLPLFFAILPVFMTFSRIGLCAEESIPDAALNVLPAGIRNSQDPRDVPFSPAESLEKITVPDGFSVTLFAAEPDIGQPIAFTLDDKGRLWVVECFSHPKWNPEGKDRVVILSDEDHDGRFDKRTVFWDQGRYLSGIALGHGGVYLCNTPELTFIPDVDANDVPDSEPEVLLDGWTRKNPNNVFNNLKFGPDGWLYGCIGQDSPSYIGKPHAADEDRQKITRGLWRFHPYDKKFEVVALGAVNPWGLDFDARGEAFFTNCVLPHLWHLIPGAYYERRPGEQDNPHVYQRIQPICDHRHWAGGVWTDSRGGEGEHGKAGGGHAHTGAMIYLAGAWPEKYWGTIFMGNIHGNRINNDWFERQQSGFVAHHHDDFLMGNNPWFRCLSQQYGPDGQVYISDWQDLGECHDSDGSHRSSGRIYKVCCDTAKHVRIPEINRGLATLTNDRLVELHLHENEWYVRQARKILHARFESGVDMGLAQQRLLKIFVDEPAVPQQLRAFWSLYVTGFADEEFLLSATDHADESVRAWSVRLLTDRQVPSEAVLARFQSLAQGETSALVRLYLAAALQRIPQAKRWPVAEALVKRVEDRDDTRLQLMIWYGIEPLVPEEPTKSLSMMKTAVLPIIRQHIARRLAESS